MSRLMIGTTLLLCGLQAAAAQRLEPGMCPPHVVLKSDFDIEKYLGVWYLYAEYQLFFEPAQRCIKLAYKRASNDSIQIQGEGFVMDTNKLAITKDLARIVAPAHWELLFHNMEKSITLTNYLILDTDYSQYAVVYSCTNIFGITNAKVVSVITREREPSHAVIKLAEHVVRRNQLSWYSLRLIGQSQCDN